MSSHELNELDTATTRSLKRVFRSDVNPYSQLVETRNDRILINDARNIIESIPKQIVQLAEPYKGIICECGSGSGAHLIEVARRAPDYLHIGIELRYKRAFRTIEKADEARVKNLYILRTDASHLSTIFPPHSLTGVYMNFPDPWGRKKWAKNRMFRGGLAKEIFTTLRNGGFFSFKSDDQPSYEEALQSWQGLANIEIVRASLNLHLEEWSKDFPTSEFELLFKNQGVSVFYFCARKICAQM